MCSEWDNLVVSFDKSVYKAIEQIKKAHEEFIRSVRKRFENIPLNIVIRRPDVLTLLEYYFSHEKVYIEHVLVEVVLVKSGYEYFPDVDLKQYLPEDAFPEEIAIFYKGPKEEVEGVVKKVYDVIGFGG